MPNWIAINEDALRAAGHGAIVDSARAQASGADDPITDALADSTSRVRRAVSAANVLDIDASKVPASFKAVALRIALFGLMRYIGLAQSPDDQAQARADQSDLNRVADNKVKVEQPDHPASSAEMQPSGSAIDLLGSTRRQTGRCEQSGL